MRLVVVLLMCAVAGSVFAKGTGFSELSYQDALARAEKEHKLVFVDVFATWCGPCKMLDRTTFRDPKVVAWMKEKSVALKIDGEAQPDIAKKYNIKAYPTLLLLKSDGSELGRVLGYVDVDTFLKEFQSLETGKDPLAVAKEALKLDPMNYEQRLKAAVLEGERNTEKGLTAFKAMLDDLHSGAMKGESTIVLLNISDLPGDEPVNFLESVKSESMVKIVGGDYSEELVKKYAVLTRAEQGVLPLYDELIAMNKSPEQLAVFKPFLIQPLRAARRFSELEALSPVSDRLATLREDVKKIAAGPGGPIAAKEEGYRFTHIFAELLGQERFPEADALAVELLGSNPSADDYNNFAWSAYEAGVIRQTEFSYAKKAYELSKGESAYILDTYARVLATQGQKDEALKLVKNALRNMTKGGMERKILSDCLEFLTQDGANGRQG